MQNSGVARYAINSLSRYPCEEIVRGSSKIKAASLIMRFATDNPDNAESILILSCFQKDSEVIKFLKEQREQHGNRATRLNPMGLPPVAKMVVCIDVALAELGDEAARSRVLQYITQARVDNLLFILQSIKWINDKRILLALTELLRDMRVVRTYALSNTPREAETKLRMADFAFEALSYKAAVDEYLDLYVSERVANNVLEKAYQRYIKLFRG